MSMVAEAKVVPVSSVPGAEVASAPGLVSRMATLGRRMLESCGVASWGSELDKQRLDPVEAAELLSTQGYARSAPSFKEQVRDRSRTNTFYFESPSALRLQTEHEGLVQLHERLEQAAGVLPLAMLENLTFIGEKEFAEGAAGLAAYWKQLLDDDPKLQLCVLAGVSSDQHTFKSDSYLRERILEHFSDDELAHYRGRLLVNPTRLTAEPKHARIVLLDDWTISGSQMHAAYSWLRFNWSIEQYEACIEAHMLTASKERIEGGLYVGRKQLLPIKAYFLAHDATGPTENGAYISGTHSSVDFDFSLLLDALLPKRSVKSSNVGRLALRFVAAPYSWSGMEAVQALRVERSAEAQ